MYHKQNNKFRSSTSIHKYNNFLLSLDEKSKQTEDNDINKNNLENTVNNISVTNKHFDLPLKEILSPDYHYNYEANIYEEPRPNITITNNVSSKEKIKVEIIADINNISDLLVLIEKYPICKNTSYNIDIETLHKIEEPLEELNNIIGMKVLKEAIVEQILFYLQNLHTNNKNQKKDDFDFMHTVIYGPPGTGKTEVAKIIGAIFSKMGILKKGTFKKVTRSELIAGYLGQTALKTRDVIKDSLGGVLFIDEAYSLGNENKQDSFSKECIDTLCESLSEHKSELMVIIAGYEDELNDCFFSLNQGLNSRFTWRFKIDEYSAEDLYNIFLKKINDYGWKLSIDNNLSVKWFELNKYHFKSYGRDIEALFAKTKIAHSRRVFCLDGSLKKKLTIKDIENGLVMYVKNKNIKQNDDDKFNKLMSSMYV